MKLKGFQKKKIIALGLSGVTIGGIFAYHHFAVEAAIKPTKVVLAAKDIPPHTEITEDMVSERSLAGDSIPPNAIRAKAEDIIGKWTTDGHGVPKNSYFFKEKVVDKDELPDAAILNLNPGEVAFPLLVDIETSSGNSIVPGSHVDLYFKYVSDNQMVGETEKVLLGGLFQQIRVTAAKDSNTEDAFKNDKSEEKEEKVESTPKVTRLYTLAVTPEQFQYLSRAKALGDIIPVATGNSHDKQLEKIQEESNFADISDQKNILTYIEKNSENPIPNSVKKVINNSENE